MTPTPAEIITATVIRTTKQNFRNARPERLAGDGWQEYLSEAWIEANRRAPMHDPARQSLEKYIACTCTTNIRRGRYRMANRQKAHPHRPGQTQISHSGPADSKTRSDISATIAQQREPGPVHEAQRNEQNIRLYKAINALPRYLREIIMEYTIECLPTSEIRSRHDLSEGGLYERLRKATRMLREVLDPNAPAPDKEGHKKFRKSGRYPK